MPRLQRRYGSALGVGLALALCGTSSHVHARPPRALGLAPPAYVRSPRDETPPSTEVDQEGYRIGPPPPHLVLTRKRASRELGYSIGGHQAGAITTCLTGALLACGAFSAGAAHGLRYRNRGRFGVGEHERWMRRQGSLLGGIAWTNAAFVATAPLAATALVIKDGVDAECRAEKSRFRCTDPARDGPINWFIALGIHRFVLATGMAHEAGRLSTFDRIEVDPRRARRWRGRGAIGLSTGLGAMVAGLVTTVVMNGRCKSDACWAAGLSGGAALLSIGSIGVTYGTWAFGKADGYDGKGPGRSRTTVRLSPNVDADRERVVVGLRGQF